MSNIETAIRTHAAKFAAESTPAGDYKAGKLSHIADLLARDVLTTREAASGANRVIAQVVTVLRTA